jgi:hypothetical protein
MLTLIQGKRHKAKHVLILQHEIKYCLANNDTMHRVCSYINATCTTSGVGTAYPSGAPDFVLLDL